MKQIMNKKNTKTSFLGYRMQFVFLGIFLFSSFISAQIFSSGDTQIYIEKGAFISQKGSTSSVNDSISTFIVYGTKPTGVPLDNDNTSLKILKTPKKSLTSHKSLSKKTTKNHASKKETKTVYKACIKTGTSNFVFTAANINNYATMIPEQKNQWFTLLDNSTTVYTIFHTTQKIVNNNNQQKTFRFCKIFKVRPPPSVV